MNMEDCYKPQNYFQSAKSRLRTPILLSQKKYTEKRERKKALNRVSLELIII